MRTHILRLFALLSALILGTLLHDYLHPHGLAWIVYLAGGSAGTLILFELLVRYRRAHSQGVQERRWEAAREGDNRQRAIDELQREIDRLTRFKSRFIQRRTRLSLLLAELLLAENRDEAASRILARIPVDELVVLPAAILRHARIQAHLYGGRHEEAELALQAIERPVSHTALEQSLRVAELAIAVESGRRDETLVSQLQSAMDELDSHDALWADVRALQAVLQQTRGEPSQAMSSVEVLSADDFKRLLRTAPRCVRIYLSAIDAPPLDTARRAEE